MEVDPRESTTAADDDDGENAYRGVFTAHRSADFMLKICFTLTVFVVILFLTSLHITRKKYRMPRVMRALSLRRSGDLLRLEGVAPMAALAKGEAVAGAIPGGWLIVHRLDLRGVKLPVQPFTCAPGWFRGESLGFLMSLASPERNILAQLVDYAFQDMPESRVEDVVRTEVHLLSLENLNVLDDYAFDSLARRICLRIILGVDEPGAARDRTLSSAIRTNLEELRALYYGTKSLRSYHRLLSFVGFPSSLREVLIASKKTLEPLIRHEMENYDPSDPRALSTFLQTFMASRLELEEEGDQTNFLTVGHLAHAAMDALLVLEEVLVPALRWGLLILGERPELAERLASEQREAKGRSGRLAEAFALELLRWSLVGSQFCAQYLLDDWDAGDVDLPAGSVLIYDLRSFSRDPRLFREPDAFRPQRFEVPGGKGTSRVKTAFLERLELAGWGACIPVAFTVDLVARALAHLAGSFKVRVEGNTTLAPARCSFARAPDPFRFRLLER